MEQPLRVTYWLLSCMLVAGMIWYMFPGLRAATRDWLRWQLYIYQLGHQMLTWDDLPKWRQEALLVRGYNPTRQAA